MRIVLHHFYYVSKELNIPPLSVKYAIVQVSCFKKWKKLKLYYLCFT